MLTTKNYLKLVLILFFLKLNVVSHLCFLTSSNSGLSVGQSEKTTLFSLSKSRPISFFILGYFLKKNSLV